MLIIVIVVFGAKLVSVLNLPLRVLESCNYSTFLSVRSSIRTCILHNLYPSHGADIFFLNLVNPIYFDCLSNFRTIEFRYYEGFFRIENGGTTPVILYYGEDYVELNKYGNYHDIPFGPEIEAQQIILSLSSNILQQYFTDNIIDIINL